MKKLLTIFLLLTCRICTGQNLVPNPSFEDTVACPVGVSDWAVDEIANAVGWNIFRETPDYLNSCADSATLVNMPNSGWGYHQAATGNAMCGMICYATTFSGFREIIGCHLITPLSVGTKYYVSFKTSMAGRSGYFGGSTIAVNKLGVKCSTLQFTRDNPIAVDNTPNFYTNSFITDTLNWVTVSGSFIADSAYQYMAIGDFFDNSQIDTIHLATTIFRSYYFIDDVCLSTDSLTCNSSVGIHEPKEKEKISLYPNPFSNQLTFTLSNNELTTIFLYDFLSRQILQQTFTSSTTINTEELADGIYFYQLRNSKGISINGKVIKH